MDTISIGKHNPRIADIRKALDRSTLTVDGLLPVESPKLLDEAISSGLQVEAVFLREGTPLPEIPQGTATYTVEPAVFKGIQSTESSQGVIALIRPRSWTMKDIFAKSPEPIVVFAGLQDPGNVGTILRAAEAFSCAGCIGLTGTASIHNSKVVRASAGSVFRIPYVWDVPAQEAATALHKSGISLVGTSPHATESIADWDWTKPAAVLIGNEGTGLTDEQASSCTRVLRIPQQIPVESLNSAIAASVVLYEAYRRRNPA